MSTSTTLSGRVRVVCELDISVFGLDLSGAGYEVVDDQTVRKAIERGYFHEADSTDPIHSIVRVVSFDLGPDPK
jgi:hypothetical protein